MKKLFSGALLLALSIGAANAQSTTNIQNKTAQKEHHRQMPAELQLSEAQKAEMKRIKAAEKAEMQALKQNNNATKEQMQAVRKKYHNQALAVLNPDQKTKLEAFRANGNKDSARHHSAKKDFVKKGALQKELNLSADQQSKMAEIRKEYQQRRKAIKDDNTLGQDEKKQQMKELAKAEQAQVKTVLTKEQLQKMQHMRKGHKKRNKHSS